MPPHRRSGCGSHARSYICLVPVSLRAHLVHVYRRCVMTPALSAQLVQERHGFLEVRRVKPLGEPAVEWREQLAGFDPFALLLPEAGQTHGGPQLQRFRRLVPGDVQGPLEAGFGLRLQWPRLLQEQDTPEATDLRFPPAFLAL